MRRRRWRHHRRLGQLDKILEFGETSVRAQAGVRVGTLVRALAERGLELPLTPEMGQISLGALAVTTLPQASYGAGDGAAVLPGHRDEADHAAGQANGRDRTRARPDARAALELRACSGIVHEVVLRVRPLTPVKIDYQVLTLKEFAARFSAHRQGAGRIAAAHFAFQGSDHGRAPHPGRRRLPQPLRNLANPQIGDAQRVARIRLDRRQRAGGAGLARRRVVGHAAGAARDGNRGRGDVRARVDARLAERSVEGAPHLQSVGVPAGRLSARCWPNTSRSAESYYKEHRYRCNVVNGASRLHQDRGSLFSVSYSGPMFTLEPSSTGDSGWDEFLIDFNDFASSLGGMPTFNQTRALQPEHVRESLRRARQVVPRIASTDRPAQPAAQQLLSPTCWASLPSYRRASLQAGHDLGFDDSNSESVMSLASSISRA